LTGIISCNGEDGRSKAGGASGGSIKLTTINFTGKGKLKANGGIGKIILCHSLIVQFICMFNICITI
jgi:hypothetical protein